MAVQRELTEAQAGALTEWLGPWTVLADLSWPALHTLVLKAASAQGEFAVKASTPSDAPGSTTHHVQREIEAHRQLSALGLDLAVPVLRFAAPELSLLVTDFVPGELVQGTAAELDADIHRQAGSFLGSLTSARRTSPDYVEQLITLTGHRLDAATDLLDANLISLARHRLEAVTPHPLEVSFTHGDFQPRNWLSDGGTLRVIDFGRGAWRHWTSDLVRLRNQQWLDSPDLETAFFDGLGSSLSDEDAQHLAFEELAWMISTVVWANAVGDTSFEQQALASLERTLAVDGS